MRTSAFNRMMAYVCALMIGISVSCGGQAVLAADDANAVWDPATHFSPHWTSVSLSSRIDNRRDSTGRNAPPQGLRYTRTLSVAGQVDIIDSSGLIGLT